MTKLYETHEASRILDLPEGRIRACVRAGFLEPQRGMGRRYHFTFQDLLVLKTTKGLLDSGVPARRIARLLNSLRRQIPPDLHLSSLTIYADGSQVVVWDGSARWEPGSGQFLFDFGGVATKEAAPVALRAVQTEAAAVATLEAAPDVMQIRAAGERPTHRVSGTGRAPIVIDVSEIASRAGVREEPHEAPAQGMSAEEWFDLACELEGESRAEARQAYHRALALDPTMADAHVNLGRQYHETRDFAKAEAHYRAAAQYTPQEPIVWFNLGVLLEDLARPHEAIHAYRQAIERDDEYADAHYNLGLLLDSLGRRTEAITHLMKARGLYGSSKRK